MHSGKTAVHFYDFGGEGISEAGRIPAAGSAPEGAWPGPAAAAIPGGQDFRYVVWTALAGSHLQQCAGENPNHAHKESVAAEQEGEVGAYFLNFDGKNRADGRFLKTAQSAEAAEVVGTGQMAGRLAHGGDVKGDGERVRRCRSRTLGISLFQMRYWYVFETAFSRA